MANITIEIPEQLRKDFINAVNKIQHAFYADQVVQKDPEKRQKALEKFMAITEILDKLENGIA